MAAVYHKQWSLVFEQAQWKMLKFGVAAMVCLPEYYTYVSKLEVKERTSYQRLDFSPQKKSQFFIAGESVLRLIISF